MINNRQQSGRRRGRGGQRQNNTGGNNNGGGGRGPESGNRIDNRTRGNAAQLLEKYKTLARDAQQAGDRVLTEYYLQFADHYFRVLSETRARYEENNPNRARQEFGNEEQGFEGEEGSENQDDDDNDFGGSFRQPQRVQQQPQQSAQPQQNRDDRPRDDRSRDDRTRDNRVREDRPREDRPREDRPREDRQRTSYQRDDRPRESQPREYQPRDAQRDDRINEQPQREMQQQARDENVRDDTARSETVRPDTAREDQPRDNRTREPRPRRDYGDDNRSERGATSVQPADDQPVAAVSSPAPRAVRRPRAQPIARDRSSDADEGEARLDIGVLPPALSLPPSISAAPAPVSETESSVVAEPKRRGRPRKIPIEAPVES